MIVDTVTRCVIATNQTYVDALKEEGSFDKEAQEIAFQKTFNAVMAILSEDMKQYIIETFGDLQVYLFQLIEAQVAQEKK